MQALYPLPVRRIRDFVISFLQIPPRDGHPCLDGWFRSLRSMGDFHPLNANHTEHTRRKRLRHAMRRRWIESRWRLRHILLVERMIGMRTGTGGYPGSM